MQIGTVIRKYRKDKNLTQEDIAKRLGVTAPAVNKWENGNSFPDISLLSPIARLLDISVDTLLSHEKELSDAEANRLVEEAIRKLKTETFDDVFQWAKERLAEYPNCGFLILWMARILDSEHQMMEMPADEKLDTFILDCYRQALESDNEGLKRSAAEALYYFYIKKEQYEQAEQYLEYFSDENPERKRKQAMICSETGRKEEAYKMLEEILYAGYQNLNMTLQDLYVWALKDTDHNKARMLAGKMQQLAQLFEFGEYHEVSTMLELATVEKDVSATLHIMERMLNNLESIGDFTKSPLYSHMTFKPISDDYLKEVREGLIRAFSDEDTYAYLKGNPEWEALVEV